MEQLTDVRLTNQVEVLGPKTVFHNGNELQASVTVNTPATGAGTIVTYSGSAPTDFGGFFVADRGTKKRIGALRNGNVTDPEEMASLRILLDAEYGNAVLGGGGKDGDLVLRNEAGEPLVHIATGGGVEGNSVHRIVTTNARFKYLAATGIMELRGPLGGRLQLWNAAGQLKIDLTGHDGKGRFDDLGIGQGTDYIASLVTKIKQLESRIAALEARR